jgi:hypothetical protein
VKKNLFQQQSGANGKKCQPGDLVPAARYPFEAKGAEVIDNNGG